MRLTAITDVIKSGQVEQISDATEQVSASSDEMVKTIEGVSAIVEETCAVGAFKLKATQQVTDWSAGGNGSTTASNTANTSAAPSENGAHQSAVT